MNICAEGGAAGMNNLHFTATCDMLDLDPAIKLKALAAFQQSTSDGGLTEKRDVQEWLCCAVYCELQRVKIKDMLDAKLITDYPTNAAEKAGTSCWNLSLTKLLAAFKVNINQFMERMKQWNVLVKNEKVFQQEIDDLHRRLCMTLIIRKHYQRVFDRLFVLPEEDTENVEARSIHTSLYEFGWLLFLTIRNELPGFATSNLVSGCQVLICTLELLYVNALEMGNAWVINRRFPGVPRKWGSDDFDDGLLLRYSALEEICSLIPDLPRKGVRVMKNAFFHKALVVLFSDQNLLGNDTFMREIIKEGLLDVNLATLNRNYTNHVADISEIDERFLSCSKKTPPVRYKPRVPYRYKQLQKLPKAMPSVITEALDPEDADVLSNVENLVLDMARTFGVSSRDHLSTDAAGECFALACRLYYQFLQRIIGSELLLKPHLKMVQLLKQRTLSVTLVACCLELALRIREDRVEELKFPFILKCYSLDAYEFQKILELVVRHRTGLIGRDLIKHLQAVEDECLGSLMFRGDSSFWKILGKAQRVPSCKEVQAREKENALGSGPEEKPRTGFVICLCKFYCLANQRLVNLCQSLVLMEHFPKIWLIAEHSFIQQGGDLLKQRNLDHLLICAIHLHARLKRLRLNFSQILQHYRWQPHARREVYRAVPLGDGQSGDIIDFYNKVYVKSMEDFAQGLRSAKEGLPLPALQETLPKKNVVSLNITVCTQVKPKNLQYCSGTWIKVNKSKADPEDESTLVELDQLIITPLKRGHSSNDLGLLASPNVLKRQCIQ
ncbi:GL22085 [Drosophila persimilis]|uniref:GL22085 n=1 Tax=Drosophila persimilis TaxID=7234 RepID=B4GEW5_DROPE|nr:retinoblastoma family protein [Drosophila persimilis]EDW34150.1 GL22085 [Drosophila persimilis]